MKPLAFYSSLISVIFVFASCHKEGKSIVIPVSSGRPYEVLVVADDQCWNSPDSALFHVLDTDVPGLPQPERSFRISRVRPESFNRSTRLFRNIIIADIQDIYTQTKFKYTRDAYASPQMIMTIQSPSQEEFAEYVSRHGQVIIDFFTRAEMNREVKLLKKKHNEVLSAKVQSLFDCDIWMPVELASYKVGQQFLWASSNLNDLNFVIYTYPYASKETFTKAYFIEKRDSVMKANLPGAKEGMYMVTADSMFVDARNIAVQGDYAYEVRGLWEMENDAMGGPFVSHARVDRTNGRIVVVEGFVYNPGKLKRDQIRKLNAALYTLKLPQEKEVGELPVDSQISEE
jgi:hypothetical protein